jgi:senataxin
MPENDILLIQGPPGTGKTHTITGIISMLMSSGAKKILICAPSNAAIDEIVTRVSQRGFVGTNSDCVSE